MKSGKLSLTPSEYEKLLKETQPVTFVPIDSSVDRGQAEGEVVFVETLSDPTEENALDKTEQKEKVLLLRDKIKQLRISSKKYCFCITTKS